MPGLAEKLEHELAKIVPNTIHAQVILVYLKLKTKQ